MSELTMALADKYHQSGTHYEGRTMTESNARALLLEFSEVSANDQDTDLAMITKAYEAGRLAVLNGMKTEAILYSPAGENNWTIPAGYRIGGEDVGTLATDAELLAYLDAQEGV